MVTTMYVRRCILLLSAVACWISLTTLTAAGAGGGHGATADDEQPPSQGVRVPCDQVMAQLTHQVSSSKGGTADLTIVAKQLGTNIVWVERCMQAYGRRVVRPGLESAEGREERLENFEEDEAEESGREDVPEPGARERPPARDNEVEREREPKIPTPGGD